MKTYKEFMVEARRKSKFDYEIYHKSYTSAVDAALELARKKGYEVMEDDIWNEISTGPRKPAEGKTNSIKIPLYKNNKPQRHMLVFQVYGMKNSYELNAYIS